MAQQQRDEAHREAPDSGCKENKRTEERKMIGGKSGSEIIDPDDVSTTPRRNNPSSDTRSAGRSISDLSMQRP
jgi:hypothetical protein